MSGKTALEGVGSDSWRAMDVDLRALGESMADVLAGEADRLKLHAFIDGKNDLDRTLWANAVELGWPAIGLPEEYGGIGFGPRGLDVLHQQLGRRVAPGPFIATLSAAQALAETADAQTRADWLPKLAAGECTIAIPVKIGASPQSGEIWLLGDTNATEALAPVDEETWGLFPLSNVASVKVWDATRTVLRANLDGIKPSAVLPGAALEASLLRHVGLAIASDSIGGARAIVEQTIAYMKDRQQFGRPIASFQALKHRVANLMTFVSSGEELVAWVVEMTALGDPDADMWVSLAKAQVTDGYVDVGTDCTQLHGGVGFTWEFDVHMYLKRARLNEMLIAPNTVMRDRGASVLAGAVRAGKSPLELPL